MKRTSTYRKLAAATAVVGGLTAYGAPALATTAPQNQGATITYSVAAGCGTCRTLNLYDNQGAKLKTLDLSPGAGSFIANVADQGVDPAAVGNFTVQATMSNLYFSTGSGYDCSTSIPSSDVSLNSLPSLLDANSLSATLQPVFNITGTLPSSLLTPLNISGLNASPNYYETGVTTTINQATMAGSNATDLLGSILSNSSLPVNLTSSLGGTFANPDDATALGCTLPSGSPAATPQPVMQGALNGLPTGSTGSLTGPLLNELSTQIGVPTTTPGVSLSSLIPGEVTPVQAMNDVAYYTGIPVQDLWDSVTNQPTALLTTIEGTYLFATLSGVTNSVTQLSGNYNASPHMTISQTGAKTGSYAGILTVTLTQS
ncbi:MAG TPA: hypothetical protein VFH58_12030 [Acidimicrobiales bacterium]|nr:hypothetical protein [Acidimicrobiales bacterium]